MSDAEWDLFELREKRRDTKMADQMDYVAEVTEAELPDDPDFYYQFIEEVIQATAETEDLDMNYFAPYHKKAGFKIAVDGLHNAPSGIPYGVLLSLAPPARFYQKGNNTDEVSLLMLS